MNAATERCDSHGDSAPAPSRNMRPPIVHLSPQQRFITPPPPGRFAVLSLGALSMPSERENLPTENDSDHGCLGLMDSVIAASNARKVGVPRVSMYDVRDFELGRQFPPGHATVEVKQELEQVFPFALPCRPWSGLVLLPSEEAACCCFLAAAAAVCVSRVLLARIEKARL